MKNDDDAPLPDTPYLLPFQVELIEKVELALEEIKASGKSQGILLLGETGTGKTTASDEIARRYPSRIDGVQLVTSVVRIALSTGADVLGTMKKAMEQLRKPVTEPRIKIRELEPQLYKAIRAHMVLIFILEEFHNILLLGETRMRGAAGDFLKNLWNMHPDESSQAWVTHGATEGRYQLLIIVSGTPDLIKVFPPNSELGSRYGTRVDAPKMRLFPPESLRLFRRIFALHCKRFGIRHLVNVNDSDLVTRCFLVTDGHLRDLEHLVQRTASYVRRAGDGAAIFAAFARAARDVTTKTILGKNPFDLTPVELADVVKRIKHGYEINAKGGRSNG